MKGYEMTDFPEMTTRTFSLWNYVISHDRMLIRSPKNQNYTHNIDILFLGVYYLNLPTMMKGLTIYQADTEHISAIETLLNINLLKSSLSLFIVESNNHTYQIVAAKMHIEKNELGFFESSLGSFS